MEYKKQPVIKTQYQFLTGNVLKWIAAVSMTVDHIAAVVLKGYVRTNLALLSDGQVIRWKMLYHSMRSAYKRQEKIWMASVSPCDAFRNTI